MTMDDDDKARRNLVAFSALVLAGAWLKLPPGGVVLRLLGADVAAQLDLGRVWSLVLVVLVYLGHRYVFSEDFKVAAAAVRESWAECRQTWCGHQVRVMLQCAVWFGIQPKIVDYDIPAHLRQVTEEGKSHGLTGGRVLLSRGLSAREEKPWTMRSVVKLHQRLNSGRVRKIDGFAPTFIWRTTAQRAPIVVLAALRFLVWSRWAALGLPPLALGLLAGGLAVWRIWQQ